MRRMLLGVSVAAGLLLGALPADAAAVLEWKDPKGDATQPLASPAPSEPALDITKASVVVKGDTVTWTAVVDKLGAGAPQGATGLKFVFELTVNDAAYTLTAIDDLFYGQATELRGGPTASAGTLPCGKCVAKIDRKASTVVFTTPVGGLSSGVRSVDKAAKVAAGAKIGVTAVKAYRTYGAGHAAVVRANYSVLADSAPAPEKGEVTL